MGIPRGDRGFPRNAGSQLLRLLLQRTTAICVVVPVRQQVTVLGVGDEEDTEQHDERHLVGLGQIFRAVAHRPARRGNTLGQHRHYLLIDAFSQTLGKVPRKPPRLLQDLRQAPIRDQGFGREQQPQVCQTFVRQQRRLALDIGLGATAATHSGLNIGGVQAHAIALDQYEPGQIFVVRLLQPVAHRRQAVEPVGRRFRRFGVAQHDRQCGAAVAAAQQTRQVVEVLDPEPERAQEVRTAAADRLPGIVLGLCPIRPLRDAVFELVQREQPFVVQARQCRFQRRQRLRQESQRRMPIGLHQHLATETLDLPDVQLGMDGRGVASRSAESGAARLQHH